MRKRGRIDSNQNQIVEAFRNTGAQVTITSDLGGGFVDIVVSFKNEWFLCEIKDGKKRPSEQELTSDEKEWHGKQQAIVYIIKNIQNVIDLMFDNNGFRQRERDRWSKLSENYRMNKFSAISGSAAATK